MKEFINGNAHIWGVTIIVKYIPTFSREFKYILESMRLSEISFTCRCPLKSFKYFIVPQLFHYATLSEEFTAAGLVKGIDAPEINLHILNRISDLVILSSLKFSLQALLEILYDLRNK